MGWRRTAVASTLATLLWAPAFGTVQAGGSETALDGPVTVMTRNVYLGTDLFPLLETAAALPRSASRDKAVERLGASMHAARALVDSTDFETRARLLAREIAQHSPDLVGLQEVATWRSGPLERDAIGVTNARDVDYDFLSTLIEKLADEDQAYRVAVAIDEVDLESPSVGPDGERPRDVRVTLRDVILVRSDASLEVTDEGRGHFRAQKVMVGPGRSFPFTRGFAWVDVRRGAESFRFVTTHLEVGDSATSHAQAREIVAGPAAVPRPVILVCDCNSDPTRPLRSLPYRVFTGAGFVDQWRTLPRRGAGHTCCVPNTLRTTDAGLFDHRVDFVFARATRQIRAREGAVVGATLAGGGDEEHLRPSDHAGLAVRIRSVPK